MSDSASNKSKKYTQEQILQMFDTIYGIAGEFWGMLVKEVCETVREVEANRQSTSQTKPDTNSSQLPDHKSEQQSADAKPCLQKYFRRKDAAEYLGISVRTLDRMMSYGLLPYYKPHGFRLFRKEELDAAMERFRVDAVDNGIRL